MTMDEQTAFEDQIAELRLQAANAHARGDISRANRFAEKERTLYEQHHGAGEPVGPGEPVIGPGGRAL